MKVQSLTNLPSDTLLVTLDVSSLYTNIPHAEGIAACIESLNTRETQSPPTVDLHGRADLQNPKQKRFRFQGTV